MKRYSCICFVTALVGATSAAPSAAAELPEYKPAQLADGHLTSVGSDSMDELVGKWVEEYKLQQPSVITQVASFGSASAPPALIEGTANLGHMARPMKGNELDDFKFKYGFEPTQIKSALCGVAVYVSNKSPIKQLTFDQLDAIYSASNKRGGKSATTWSDLGLAGQLGARPIMALGIVADSQPNTYFKQMVLLQGEFKESVTAIADTRSIIETIAANDNAIGYGNFASLTPEQRSKVKLIAVARDASSSAVLPSEQSIQSGEYPLARALNLYFVRYPGKPMDAAVRDFLTFALSRQGQKIVAREGLVPLSGALVEEELQKIQ